MADALLGPAVQVLLDKALSLAADRVGLVLGFKEDLEKLKRSARMIEAILADAKDNQTPQAALQLWLEGLKRVAFDAYIVLDELNYKSLRRQVKSRNLIQRKVCSFSFFTKDDLSFRWRMASKVRDINIKLKNINQEATQFGLVNMATPLVRLTTGVASSRETNSLAAPYVVGRDNDESKIVEILLCSSETVVSVLPIVGMGGLGKTTLAKSVYNNQQIHEYFNKKIWVCVSEKFEVMGLFKLILESLTGKGVEFASMDNVVQKIRKELEGKRYLLVLDDVWNDIPELWDTFFDSLVGISASHGSKCLVTTRLQKVASIVSPHHPPYVLTLLTDDECFSIIKQKVVQSGENIPEELILIRERVIKRCDGLPLAANVIGGLLLLQEKEKWRSIVESRLWNFGEVSDNNRINQTLKLSFDYLPSHSIKKCFAYCSLFNKDAGIDGDLLIELWMAEGFLQTDLPDKMMEEIGGEYLDIFLQSSLFEKVEGMKNYYKMHDLVHDLTQSLSKLQRFRSESSNDEINNCAYGVRYLALDMSAEIMSLNDTSALILKQRSISNEMLLKFKHLHTLNLSEADITELPSSIGKLKHLRFLAISSFEIKCLPESVCKLYNLQTWRINRCRYLDVLPQGMHNLISLRNLHYITWNTEFKMPLEMGRLTSLQTLEFFNVGEELGRQIDELGPLKFLKGTLRIRNLELVKGKEGAERAELSGKQNLRQLEFYWSSSVDREAVEIKDDKNVLYGLKPHENLEVLKIENFKGSRFPQWLANLSKLVKLKLRGCDKCKELPTLGHLPSLENLVINMENVSCIGASFYGLDDGRGGGGLSSSSSFGGGQVTVSITKLFPALKNLNLESMKSLVEWEAAAVNDDVVVFPVLENLTIESGSLISAPTHFPSLKSLNIDGNVQALAVKNILSKVTGTLESLYLKGLDGLTSLCDLHAGPTDTANSHFTSLKEFRVSACKGLISIARETLEGLTSLASLVVSDCPNLIYFPLDLQQTPSLSTVSLKKCPKLFTDKNGMPRGFGHLTSLERLSIGPFSTDDCSMELFDWCGLKSCSSTLRYLSLYGSPHTESVLPAEFQHFTALVHLYLEEFGSIEALPDWLGNLVSLEELWLWNCEKLRYLPSLRRLTKLRELEIYCCPLLKETCRSTSGPDSEWSKKISQLPNLKIHIY